ncbi:MAG: phospholipid carrier-dependent glycosyltransferase, partial [Paraprevotella sp.]|nr:phospholipid carrier-dependent glycosyltransferase [Paraprevotella sp.]
PYALLLPFIIAFAITARPNGKKHIKAITTAIIVALVLGSSWYVYVNLTCTDTLHAVIEKESGSWINHNVRAWYYYWKFFLETGVWSLLLLTAIILPLFNRNQRTQKQYLFPLLWLTASLVLLSLLPEKKTRYLLPTLIPACYLMGTMVNRWITEFRNNQYTIIDKISMRTNTLLIALATIILPIAAWIFLYKSEHITLTELIITAITAAIIATLIIISALKLRPMMMLISVTTMFLLAECFALPMIAKVINNQQRRSIALTRDIKEIKNIPFYHSESEPLRIELVYAANKKIKPLNIKNRDTLLAKTPCVILTHKPLSQTVAQSTLKDIDTIYIGIYDDNRRPKGTRRYSDEFIYHLTLLKQHQK